MLDGISSSVSLFVKLVFPCIHHKNDLITDLLPHHRLTIPSVSPVWVEFLWLLPQFRIVLECVDRDANRHAFRDEHSVDDDVIGRHTIRSKMRINKQIDK